MRTAARAILLRATIGVPAVATMAVAPVAAAQAGQWVTICTGEGARLIRLAGLPALPREEREERMESLCAHATCPRPLRLERKGRGHT